jgi:hypothetical protein
MSLYLRMAPKVSTLSDPSSALSILHRELDAARVAYEARLQKEPTVPPAKRRAWLERQRLVQAEKNYKDELKTARSLWK